MRINILNLGIITCLSSLLAFPALAAEKSDSKQSGAPVFINRDFGEDDHTADSWKTSQGVPLKTAKIDEEHGASLIIPATFPGIVQAQRGTDYSPVYLALYSRQGKRPTAIVEKVGFDVYVPHDIPSGTRVGCTFYAKGKDGVWFQAHPVFVSTGKTATALEKGWNRLEADISEATGYLEPVGNKEKWSRLHLGLTRQFGFNIFCDQEYKGNFAIDNFSAWMAEDKFTDKFSIVAFRPGKKSLPRMQMYEAGFYLNRPILNPYNTKEVDIVAEVTREGDKKTTLIPAFFYQDFQRLKGSDKEGEDYRDKYIALPGKEFRLRITPQQAGKYKYRIKARFTSTVTGKTEEYIGDYQEFTATEAQSKGFVRVSSTDKRAFEFMDKSYFYPVGYNFHSPVDTRYVSRVLKQFFPDVKEPLNTGLRIYEDAMPKMKAAGINTFEVWMSSWWLGLEWTSKWKGYHGLNYYNQEHAWKLDSLLESCRQQGLYVHLVIDNHGKASEFCDPEWNLSPYNTRNEGINRSAIDFFTSPVSRSYYKDKYRYIAARWGYSPEIFGIELWSEFDLTGPNGRRMYKSAECRKWLEDMAKYLREQDHSNHPITVHYASNYHVIDNEVVNKPYIDYIVGDAYHQYREVLTDLLKRTQESLYQYDKPYMITEYCGNSDAAELEVLYGDMYSGLWFTWCTNAAGGPYSWWYNLINQENYYHMYKAFTNYTSGEDKRRAQGQPQLTVNWQASVKSGETNSNLKKIDDLVAEDEKNAISIDPKTNEKTVKPRPFKTVINGKRYMVSNVKLLAEIRKLANNSKSYKSQILGDGNIFYCYIYETSQLARMPLKEEERDISKEIGFELKTTANATYNIEIWDCYKGLIIKTLNDVQADDSGMLRMELPDFRVQCALKIRKTK